MRVAYDAAPLLHTPTGVGHYTRSLLESLLDADPGLEVDLWTISLRGDTSRVPVSGRINLKHMRLPARVIVWGWERVGIPKAESLFGRTDVVHGTNFWIPPLKDRNGVVTIHDLTFKLYPEMCTPPVQRYEWIVPKVLRRCKYVITPSETVKSQVVEELRFPEEAVVVTPEGIRGAFLGAQPSAELMRDFGLGADYVVFAGTQEPRKNLDRLIQAFRNVSSGTKLVIVGPPGWGSVNLPAFARKIGLADRVVFSGYLSDKALGSLMAGCRAFVFPTIYEGFGLPPLEAMAAGVPVVSSRGGALPEVLGDAPFYCDALDTESITAAIEEAIRDGPARDAAIEKGKQQAAKYSWRETARLTLETYKRIAA